VVWYRDSDVSEEHPATEVSGRGEGYEGYREVNSNNLMKKVSY
jgi:hypothetical protein